MTFCNADFYTRTRDVIKLGRAVYWQSSRSEGLSSTYLSPIWGNWFYFVSYTYSTVLYSILYIYIYTMNSTARLNFLNSLQDQARYSVPSYATLPVPERSDLIMTHGWHVVESWERNARARSWSRFLVDGWWTWNFCGELLMRGRVGSATNVRHSTIITAFLWSTVG